MSEAVVQQLTCELPDGWRLVDIDALLALYADGTDELDGEVPEAAAALRRLPLLDTVAIAAVRVNEASEAEAGETSEVLRCDFLTIALPPSDDLLGVSPQAREALRDPDAREIELGTHDAVVHRTGRPGSALGIWASTVQLTVPLGPQRPVAILTLQSTEPGFEDALEREGSAVGASLELL